MLLMVDIPCDVRYQDLRSYGSTVSMRSCRFLASTVWARSEQSATQNPRLVEPFSWA